MAVRLKPLADQVIVITGASSGIGLVTARAAARRGAAVMLRAAVAALEAEGCRAAFAVADVGSLADVRKAATATVARFGRIDTWVNCAGVAIYAKLLDTPEDEHRQLFRTNYFGVVHGSLTAVDHLRAAGGALITIGSIAGDIPTPIMGAYDASKHAVKGFVDSLRLELNMDKLPISVTLIKPSGIDTPIAEHAANHVDGEARIPPPVYDPELVAAAILDAAVRPRRAVTVGGVGRLQVLAGMHFPGLLARFGGLLAPLLSDPGLPRTASANLAVPARDGAERSRDESGRSFSLYAARRPAALAALAGVVTLAALRRHRRSADKS